MRIVVINHVTLDGVMQGPGRPGEDDRNGFDHSGWASPRSDDEVVAQALGAQMARTEALLLGRRTYEDILGHWNSVGDNPFAEPLNAMTKHVVTTHAERSLPWPNSTPIVATAVEPPVVPEAVRELAGRDGGDLGIMGSSVLVHALQRQRLIDRYLLLIHPLVLGVGIRLFADGGPSTTLRLAERATTAATGVIVALYDAS